MKMPKIAGVTSPYPSISKKKKELQESHRVFKKILYKVSQKSSSIKRLFQNINISKKPK